MDSMKDKLWATNMGSNVWQEYLKESALLKRRKRKKWGHFGSQLGYLDKEMQVVQ